MSYEKFVTNYHRYTHTARTTDEAYKTDRYCSAITVFESETKKSVEYVLNLAIYTIFVMFVSAFTYWIIYS